jgi:hypothetical protein
VKNDQNKEETTTNKLQHSGEDQTK